MISSILIEYFKKSNIPVHYFLPEILQDKAHKHHQLVVDFLRSFPSKDIDDFLADSRRFRLLSGRGADRETLVRRELAIDLLHKEISRCRLQVLVPPLGETPLPYTHEQLKDVNVDKNWLVNFNDLGGRKGLGQGGYVFHILPSLPQLHSMYWCIMKLCDFKSSADVLVRLDPFMVCPREGYSSMGYKMFVYGVPLDWADIENLQEERHVRWMPDDPDRSDVAFTDAVWTPRENEVHFTCEEVPKAASCDVRGGRYFHSIYSLRKKCFDHADGAIRIYTEDEVKKRQNSHVRNSGKAGSRVKVFQVDGCIDRDRWSSLVAAFYVWNNDVQKYFNPDYPF